jgi:hypothetical protein
MRKSRSSRSKRPVRSVRKSRSSRSKRPDKSMRKCRKDSVNFGFYGRPYMNPMTGVKNTLPIIEELNTIENCDSNIFILAYNNFYLNYNLDQMKAQTKGILNYRNDIWKSVLRNKSLLNHDIFLFGSRNKNADKNNMKLVNSPLYDNEIYLMTCFGTLNFPSSSMFVENYCFYNNKDANDSEMHLFQTSAADTSRSKISLEIIDLEKGYFAYIWNNIEILLKSIYAIYILKNPQGNDKRYPVSLIQELINKSKDKPNEKLSYKNKEDSNTEKQAKIEARKDYIENEKVKKEKEKLSVSNGTGGSLGGGLF